MRTRSKLSILLSILLCCTMLAGLLPTVAFAEDSTTVSSENGAGTSSENGADTSSKNGADTSSKNGADTTSENGADTPPENGADTPPENGTAAPAARALGCAFRCMDWGNRIPDIGGGGKCRCKR